MMETKGKAKLKYEHIHLTSFSKMRVDSAAQVSTIYRFSQNHWGMPFN